MKINLHIKHLIINGLSVKSSQKKQLKMAVESALINNLTVQGIGSAIQSKNNYQSITGGSISIENCNKTANLGRQIGNAVYRGIKK